MFNSGLLKGTTIRMADGTKKNVEDIEVGDIVETYNILDNAHLRFSLTQQNSSSIYSAIGFGLANKYPNILNKKLFNAVFTVDQNDWNGKQKLQLKVMDIKN